MDQIRKILLLLILPGVAIAAALSVAEVGLHVLPVSLTGIRSPGAKLLPHPTIGFIPKPNQSTQVASECFNTTIKTNSLGFHDVEWPKILSGGIAVLGDSFVWAGEGPRSDTATAHIQEKLSMPVINAGIFSLGTFGEHAVFNAFVKDKKPAVVVLFLYPGNDVIDNNCIFYKTQDGLVTKACGEKASDGSIHANTDFYVGSGNAGIKQFLKANCRVCKLIRDATLSWNVLDTSTPKKTSNGSIPGYEIYTTDTTKDLTDSWDLTEYALRGLNQDILDSGAKLVVVLVPEVPQVIPDGKAFLEKKLGIMAPDTFDLSVATKRLIPFFKELNVPVLELAPYFYAYREKYNLPYPYFSYWCDGHWNPLGHEVASVAVLNFLRSSGLVPAEAFKGGVTEPASPEEVLGKDGYAEIFQNGIYRTDKTAF